jgi:hypothetical protein
VPHTVTPIWTVARNWSMLSWRAFTREAARLPSSTRLSMRLRRAAMIAISLPEKKPFPSRRRTIEAAMKSGSDMTGDPHGTKGAPLPPPCSRPMPLVA